ncbi:MAG TPA: hypothetical protein VE152_06225, partial [Acidimicrobiales bacterium]|nr:hypothetical protein [Acidimicrobiales bacterium]
ATHRPLLVLVSDGRATAGPTGRDPVAAAREAAAAVAERGVASVVVDADEGPAPLGLARSLADAMGAALVGVEDLTAGSLAGVVRDAAPR